MKEQAEERIDQEELGDRQRPRVFRWVFSLLKGTIALFLVLALMVISLYCLINWSYDRQIDLQLRVNPNSGSPGKSEFIFIDAESVATEVVPPVFATLVKANETIDARLKEQSIYSLHNETRKFKTLDKIARSLLGRNESPGQVNSETSELKTLAELRALRDRTLNTSKAKPALNVLTLNKIPTSNRLFWKIPENNYFIFGLDPYSSQSFWSNMCEAVYFSSLSIQELRDGESFIRFKKLMQLPLLVSACPVSIFYPTSGEPFAQTVIAEELLNVALERLLFCLSCGRVSKSNSELIAADIRELDQLDYTKKEGQIVESSVLKFQAYYHRRANKFRITEENKSISIEKKFRLLQIGRFIRNETENFVAARRQQRANFKVEKYFLKLNSLAASKSGYYYECFEPENVPYIASNLWNDLKTLDKELTMTYKSSLRLQSCLLGLSLNQQFLAGKSPKECVNSKETRALLAKFSKLQIAHDSIRAIIFERETKICLASVYLSQNEVKLPLKTINIP